MQNYGLTNPPPMPYQGNATGPVNRTVYQTKEPKIRPIASPLHVFNIAQLHSKVFSTGTLASDLPNALDIPSVSNIKQCLWL